MQVGSDEQVVPTATMRDTTAGLQLTLPDHPYSDIDANDTGVDDTEDLVYAPQRTTQDAVDLLHAAVVLDFNSFDGGERCAGRLQDGAPDAVSLFSRECIGLAASAVLTGACLAVFASAFRPLFITGFLRPSHPHLVGPAESFLRWPPVLSLFIGVLSDAVPVCGYQRKPYLIIGWLTTSVSLALAASVSYSSDVISSTTAAVLVALAVVASLGMQIVWVVSLAITVEHAQRESTNERGHFQGVFFLVYYSATALTHTLTTRLLVTTNADVGIESAISLQHVLLLLSSAAWLAILSIVLWFHEYRVDSERDTATKLSAMDEPASGGLSAHLQQKPAYRIYFFLFGAVFLATARSGSVDSAILSWCNISKEKFGNVTVAQAMPKVVAVVVWKWFMINLNWRVLGVAGLALFSLCKLALVATVGLGLARGDWVYYSWTAVASIPLGWLDVFMVILPTEVAGVGHEGLAISIVASFMGLIGIMSTTLWDLIDGTAGFVVSASDIAADAPAARHRVVVIGVAYALLNLSSVLLAPLLPRQKLDAQRWRAFGGANKPASQSLACAFVLLALYNVLVHWLQVRSL
jgi:MFS family permease